MASYSPQTIIQQYSDIIVYVAIHKILTDLELDYGKMCQKVQKIRDYLSCRLEQSQQRLREKDSAMKRMEGQLLKTQKRCLELEQSLALERARVLDVATTSKPPKTGLGEIAMNTSGDGGGGGETLSVAANVANASSGIFQQMSRLPSPLPSRSTAKPGSARLASAPTTPSSISPVKRAPFLGFGSPPNWFLSNNPNKVSSKMMVKYGCPVSVASSSNPAAAKTAAANLIEKFRPASVTGIISTTGGGTTAKEIEALENQQEEEIIMISSSVTVSPQK